MKKDNEKKYFIVHKENILHNNLNEETKMYIDISKIVSIKNIIELIKENLIKIYENKEYTTEEDIKKYKKYMEKKGKKEILENIEKNNYILYSEETKKIKGGKIIKYEPQEIMIETMFEKIFN